MSVVAVRVAESWSSCVVGPRGWRAPAGRGACCALGRAREASAGGGGMAPMPPLSGGGSGGSAPPSPAGAAPTPTASSLLLRGVLSSASGRFFAWNPIKRDAASVSAASPSLSAAAVYGLSCPPAGDNGIGGRSRRGCTLAALTGLESWEAVVSGRRCGLVGYGCETFVGARGNGTEEERGTSDCLVLFLRPDPSCAKQCCRVVGSFETRTALKPKTCRICLACLPPVYPTSRVPDVSCVRIAARPKARCERTCAVEGGS